jgi:hypothetical protein
MLIATSDGVFEFGDNDGDAETRRHRSNRHGVFEMPLAMDYLKAELAGLTEQERAELAQFLLHTLEGTGADADTDAEIEAAWDAELARRGDEIQRGVAVGKPAEQVFAELRQNYRVLTKTTEQTPERSP